MLLPDLGAMLAVAALVYCLFIYGGRQQLFRDSDSGWHIRNGEAILARHVLPRTDPYSFSKPNEPWYAWEWASDVIMGAAHSLDGLRGVAALFSLTIAATVWLWSRLSFAMGGDFFLTAVLAPPMITTASLHWLARPHVLSWLFLLAALLAAERLEPRFRAATARERWLSLAAIALFTAAWANIHASFFLAPAIALIFAAAHWILRERDKSATFLYAAAAASLGSLLNPFGWRLHWHILSYLRDDELTAHVAEFQSFNFHDKDAFQITLALAVAAMGGVLALQQRKLAHFFLAAIFFWGALRSARLLPLVALAILPIANGAITQALQDGRAARRLSRLFDYSAGLRRIDRQVSGAAFTVLAVILVMLLLRAPAYSSDIGFAPDRFPVAAAAAVEKLPATARILSTDLFGGYLLYRFSGERRVYFDGRSDFYGADFMKQYLVLITARPGWRETMEKYRFTHALLPADSALTDALERSGWATLYQDKVATLLEAR